jgi:hypothetical protein
MQILCHSRPNMERMGCSDRTAAVRYSLRLPALHPFDPLTISAKHLIQIETVILARNLQSNFLSGCTP